LHAIRLSLCSFPPSSCCFFFFSLYIFVPSESFQALFRSGGREPWLTFFEVLFPVKSRAALVILHRGFLSEEMFFCFRGTESDWTSVAASTQGRRQFAKAPFSFFVAPLSYLSPLNFFPFFRSEISFPMHFSSLKLGEFFSLCRSVKRLETYFCPPSKISPPPPLAIPLS